MAIVDIEKLGKAKWIRNGILAVGGITALLYAMNLYYGIKLTKASLKEKGA